MNILNIAKDAIEEALDFYNITDCNYKNSCYECLENILNNAILIARFNEIYKLVFLNNLDRAQIKELWNEKSVQEVFDNNCHPFITNLLLLSGYKKHIENMNKHNLDTDQRLLHIKRVHDSLTNDIYDRKYPGIRISQMLWGAYFINIKLIEIGRLQYELCNSNPLDGSVNEKIVKIHIPKGDKLNIEDVKKSIKNSRLSIKKYFKLENPTYYCLSWLLSKEIREIVEKDSNIYNFYDVFDAVTPGYNATSDILNFVFGLKECNDFNTLPENTSLQKKLKEMLLNENNVNIGIGILYNK